VATAEEAPPVEETPAFAGVPPVAEDSPPEVEPVAGPREVEPSAAPLRAGVLALRLENERGSGSTFEVTKTGATIGRGPESTIQLADLSVSRKHAKIAYRQGAYWLSDLGSMGGTWVDGAKLAAPRRIAPGQTIDIGVCRLTVVSAGADEEPPAARATPHAASRPRSASG
jgi:predicted component of type VI protein secretion system